MTPANPRVRSSRRYLPGSMILETRFDADDATVLLYDCLAIGDEALATTPELVRIVVGLRGSMELDVTVMPRFDLGELMPHLSAVGDAWIAIAGNEGLLIRADGPLRDDGQRALRGRWRIRRGGRLHLSVRFVEPHRVDIGTDIGTAGQPWTPDVLGRRLARSLAWWRHWSAAVPQLPVDAQTMRSLLVLKALTYEETGAVIAAPTTSLPEAVQGRRNWDYRYSWVRDASLMVRTLDRLGYSREAERFHRFVLRSCAGDATQLQIMYAVDGARRLTEIEHPALAGYRGAQPVRTGNRAACQRQNDVYGELMLMAWEWHEMGGQIDDEYWRFLCSVVEGALANWMQPDHGIWELRDAPRHLVHSKALCWAAVDCGIRLAQALAKAAPLSRWQAARDAIRAAIEQHGYDHERGIFVHAFGGRHLDAALLLLPHVGFLAYDDDRMVRTTEAVRKALSHDGLLRRYYVPDGLPPGEGVFLPCTFWLVACLARQGRHALAQAYYDRALAWANDLGLFSEECDVTTRHMLGNFPQGLTHVAQIRAHEALRNRG